MSLRTIPVRYIFMSGLREISGCIWFTFHFAFIA